MDAAEPEFAAHVGSVPLLQLQSLLESAVRGTSAAADPAAAKLAACFDHRSILNMLIANQQALAAPGGEGAPKTPGTAVRLLSLCTALQGRGEAKGKRCQACSGSLHAHAVASLPSLPPFPPCVQLKPATPAPMTASERSTIGKKRTARESFMLSYEVHRRWDAGWGERAAVLLLKLCAACSLLTDPHQLHSLRRCPGR